MPAPDIAPPVLIPASLLSCSGPPRPALPLQGLTVLAVEDSRFASEALRLLCQRSGARLRRAETLAAAHRHLLVYRPDVVIVDLGLPDGDGTGLIRQLTHEGRNGALVLGTSGDPSRRGAALMAGAAGFLEKPLESLAAFQAVLLRHGPGPAAAAAGDLPRPDPMALRDDLARAAALLARMPDAAQRRYLAGFLGGVARAAHDVPLAQAASQAAAAPQRLPALAALVRARLAAAPAAFVPPHR